VQAEKQPPLWPPLDGLHRLRYDLHCRMGGHVHDIADDLNRLVKVTSDDERQTWQAHLIKHREAIANGSAFVPPPPPLVTTSALPLSSSSSPPSSSSSSSALSLMECDWPSALLPLRQLASHHHARGEYNEVMIQLLRAINSCRDIIASYHSQNDNGNDYNDNDSKNNYMNAIHVLPILMLKCGDILSIMAEYELALQYTCVVGGLKEPRLPIKPTPKSPQTLDSSLLTQTKVAAPTIDATSSSSASASASSPVVARWPSPASLPRACITNRGPGVRSSLLALSWYWQSIIYRRAKNLDMSRHCIDEALTIDEVSWRFMYQRAIIRYYGHHDDCIKWFERAIARAQMEGHTPMHAWYRLAKAYYRRRHEPGRALHLFEQCWEHVIDDASLKPLSHCDANHTIGICATTQCNARPCQVALLCGEWIGDCHASVNWFGRAREAYHDALTRIKDALPLLALFDKVSSSEHHTQTTVMTSPTESKRGESKGGNDMNTNGDYGSDIMDERAEGDKEAKIEATIAAILSQVKSETDNKTSSLSTSSKATTTSTSWAYVQWGDDSDIVSDSERDEDNNTLIAIAGEPYREHARGSPISSSSSLLTSASSINGRSRRGTKRPREQALTLITNRGETSLSREAIPVLAPLTTLTMHQGAPTATFSSAVASLSSSSSLKGEPDPDLTFDDDECPGRTPSSARVAVNNPSTNVVIVQHNVHTTSGDIATAIPINTLSPLSLSSSIGGSGGGEGVTDAVDTQRRQHQWYQKRQSRVARLERKQQAALEHRQLTTQLKRLRTRKPNFAIAAAATAAGITSTTSLKNNNTRKKNKTSSNRKALVLSDDDSNDGNADTDTDTSSSHEKKKKIKIENEQVSVKTIFIKRKAPAKAVSSSSSSKVTIKSASKVRSINSRSSNRSNSNTYEDGKPHVYSIAVSRYGFLPLDTPHRRSGHDEDVEANISFKRKDTASAIIPPYAIAISEASKKIKDGSDHDTDATDTNDDDDDTDNDPKDMKSSKKAPRAIKSLLARIRVAIRSQGINLVMLSQLIQQPLRNLQQLMRASMKQSPTLIAHIKAWLANPPSCHDIVDAERARLYEAVHHGPNATFRLFIRWVIQTNDLTVASVAKATGLKVPSFLLVCLPLLCSIEFQTVHVIVIIGGCNSSILEWRYQHEQIIAASLQIKDLYRWCCGTLNRIIGVILECT
jgi:tetratricopeptide (TPR) repeat protein